MRKKIKLSREDKKNVKEWLELPYVLGISVGISGCPIAYNGVKHHDICMSWFPRVAADGGGTCPCHNYGYEYVRKIAREMIEK